MRSIKLPSWIERLLGVGPRPVPPHVFGVSGDELVYASFGEAGGGYVLREFVRQQLAPGVMPRGPLGGPVRDARALEEAVVELVGRLEEVPRQASLVVPDEWLRLLFVESDDLPRSEEARTDVLRWKLKHEVPFRVEDLRVRGAEVPVAEGQSAPRRLLVAFGAEALMAALESCFRAAGVQVGHIANESMGFAEAASSGRGGEVLVWGGEGGYSVVVLRDGQPVLTRSKRLDEELDGSIVAGMVEREIRLTLSFLHRHFPGFTLERIVVAAPADADQWLDAVRRGAGNLVDASTSIGTLERDDLAQRVRLDSVPSSGPGANDWWTLLPLAGAALRRVA